MARRNPAPFQILKVADFKSDIARNVQDERVLKTIVSFRRQALHQQDVRFGQTF
jgi:hypothetical protein